MPPNSRVQFAIVREDPSVELALLPQMRDGAQPRALITASGGCTALALLAERPDVSVTALDLNSAQLELVSAKRTALQTLEPGPARDARFGIGADDPNSLNGCGNFESLFRGLRAVLDDLVMTAADRRALFDPQASVDDSPARVRALVEHRFWPVAFSMFFSDAMLETMFGPDATQHAARGSYPGYFRGVVERGLARADRVSNRYLQHVLCGAWLPHAVPSFMRLSAAAVRDAKPFELVHAPMAEAPALSSYALVSLSNLFDWMNEEAITAIARRLEQELQPGTVVAIRQLNNRSHVERFLPSFAFDDARAQSLLERDQSLFYERLLVGVKR
jgi:S-adenosylmethionine-diacylglycerol 3-amino-3-carboxypropyl transferase